VATTTYTPIYTTTLSSAQASVTFNSFSGYTDLVIVGNCGISNTGTTMTMRFNGDTGSNYSELTMSGNGSVKSSSKANNITSAYLNDTTAFNSSTEGNFILNIMNYANTTTYKTVIGRVTRASSGNYPGTAAWANMWRSTSAITSIVIFPADGSNIISGSTFTLYGIANADIGALATGGTITYDDTYFYHTFGSSGVFTPKQSLTADVLQIAGGGGGSSGGGGAGGLRYYSAQSLTATAYTCTVGGGGAKGTGYGVPGSRGDNSQFGALGVSTGGGGGGGHENTNDALTGGSGGGGASAAAGTSNGAASSPATSPVQGYAGGGNGGQLAPPYASGGGGGAGAVGSNASSNTQSGAGGAGSNTYSSFASATGTGVSGYYAGGGGGGMYNSGGSAGAGGAGGGGAGSVNTATATNGTANTGGGGGGGGTTGTTGGVGGSGIVIIRYLKA